MWKLYHEVLSSGEGGRVVTQFVDELKQAISELRLERYRPPDDGNELEMLINYYWNMALADALLCSLGTVELLLRNTIHDTLSNYFGRSDWYDGTGLLEPKQVEQLGEAKHHIETRKKPVTPERVVSNLTFGFWVTLLSGNYNDRFWRPNKAENLRTAFPFVPKKSRQRGDIQNKYYRANNLRNLAFHHEPIFDRISLRDDYRRAYEAIEWIDPTMAPKTMLFDRFPEVHENGRGTVEEKLRRHLGL